MVYAADLNIIFAQVLIVSNDQVISQSNANLLYKTFHSQFCLRDNKMTNELSLNYSRTYILMINFYFVEPFKRNWHYISKS